MKKLIIIICFSFTIINCEKTEKKSYPNEIKEFQYQLNTEFSDASKSPLTKEDLKTFRNLNFYKIDKNYRIEAEFEKTPNTPIFKMQTTTDRLPLYRQYGIARFTLNDTEVTLSIYQNQSLMASLEYENHLFLPFSDLTNGESTYGGGRYIDLKLPLTESKIITIDFNKAYNPYCAYNHKYSCPIPPAENNLPLEIKAGVKKFKNKH